MKSKKLKVGALALALVFAMSGSVFAIGGSPGGGYPLTPSEDEYQSNGDTTISIFESSQNAENMNYTIPLYVTMAVSAKSADAAVPDNYGIINNSKGATTAAPMNIGVIGMTFEKLPNSTYKTVAADPLATALDEIRLYIGGVEMPALGSAGIADVSDVSMKVTGSKFHDTTGKVIAIPVSKDLYKLPIVGKVAKAETRNDKAGTVAQFRVRYTISLLTATGDTVGNVYAGSERQKAGLKQWVDPAPPTSPAQ